MNVIFGKLRRFLLSDWGLAALILAIFLLTNRYIFGWDDQHLEVPLLKHLIDPTLYSGDYYVEGLKNNFTTFFYPILARLITVDSIPAVYMGLFLLVRYFFFFWIFRLWVLISNGNRTGAFLATVTIFLVGRTEEMIYRTFSHQEFSYPIIFFGIWLFYQGRYFWAAASFGLAANFHALYALYPMQYMVMFIWLFAKKDRWRTFFIAAGIFVATALPFIVWTFARALKTRLHADPHVYDDWIQLYLLSCPQTFLFGDKPLQEVLRTAGTLLAELQNYIFMLVLYIVHLAMNPRVRQDLRLHALMIVAFGFIGLTYVFSYIIPSHFILDLNLVRNEQYVRVFLVGYTALLAWENRRAPFWTVLLLGVLVAFNGGKEPIDIVITLAAGALLVMDNRTGLVGNQRWGVAAGLLVLAVAFMCLAGVKPIVPWLRTVRILGLAGIWGVLTAGYFFCRGRHNWTDRIKAGLIIAPFAVMFCSFCYNHYLFVRVSEHGGGFWQLQRNWEDMQRHVNRNTPKNAVIMAPNDMEMGGFRIHSNRRLLVDYRDCGIIGFDIQATVEWRRRMQDIEAFKVMVRDPLLPALMNGISKYHADYIVFMKYAAPPDNPVLSRMYENEAFVLYKVNRTN